MGWGAEFDRCKPWIEAALAYAGGTHTVDDVAHGIAEHRMQFWPAERGCLVTEVLVFPRKTVLNVFLAGGELGQLLDMRGDVIAWAKSMGCTGAYMTGRKGWERAMPGWSYLGTALEMGFD